ncbi:hypothetical protein F4692_001202 [Nocardioides cavernae]|uniref:Uncharacterized protein n=1 Tax=Nocardioides cavernae TaxID=1921566 RepID=A0A7Y9H1A7_9ACTN|nr:hypothetical protein [Nocardioides cavernae]NYE36098.1 hypothetical protein [Nocardioides cavernae]
MGDIRVDADLIRGISASLRLAASHMSPSYDRFGTEDVVQVRSHADIDTLAGAETRAGNFGAFHAGQSLRSVYEVAHQRTVEDRQAQARKVRRFARALDDSLGDLEGTDELHRDHFRRLAQLALDED